MTQFYCFIASNSFSSYGIWKFIAVFIYSFQIFFCQTGPVIVVNLVFSSPGYLKTVLEGISSTVKIGYIDQAYLKISKNQIYTINQLMLNNLFYISLLIKLQILYTIVCSLRSCWKYNHAHNSILGAKLVLGSYSRVDYSEIGKQFV